MLIHTHGIRKRRPNEREINFTHVSTMISNYSMYLATSLPWWFRTVTKIDIQAIEIAATANLSIVAINLAHDTRDRVFRRWLLNWRQRFPRRGSWYGSLVNVGMLSIFVSGEKFRLSRLCSIRNTPIIIYLLKAYRFSGEFLLFWISWSMHWCH